jgi:hypothetical protein
LRAKCPPPKKSTVMFFDEKGTRAVRPYGGKGYAEAAPEIGAKQEVSDLFELFSAYDIHTRAVVCCTVYEA